VLHAAINFMAVIAGGMQQDNRLSSFVMSSFRFDVHLKVISLLFVPFCGHIIF
jgi:hypothetical protein